MAIVEERDSDLIDSSGHQCGQVTFVLRDFGVGMHGWLNGRALTKQETASTRPHVVQQNVSSNMYKSSVRRRAPIKMCDLSQ